MRYKSKSKSKNVRLFTAQCAQVQLQNRNYFSIDGFGSLFVVFTIDRDIQIFLNSFFFFASHLVLQCESMGSGNAYFVQYDLCYALFFARLISHQWSCQQLSIYSFDEWMFVVWSQSVVSMIILYNFKTLLVSFNGLIFCYFIRANIHIASACSSCRIWTKRWTLYRIQYTVYFGPGIHMKNDDFLFIANLLLLLNPTNVIIFLRHFSMAPMSLDAFFSCFFFFCFVSLMCQVSVSN